MRIAVLADIHGNLPALEAVLTDIARRQVDRVVTLGDHVSGPLLPQETAALLVEQSWLQIAGNHERQLLSFDPATAGPSDRYAHPRLGEKQFAWLRGLPPTAEMEGGVLLCHGSPRSDTEYLLESVEAGSVRLATADEIAKRMSGTSAPVVLCGHTHVPRSVRTDMGQLLVNPGSVGLPAFDDVKPSYHVVETGSPDARYAILECSAAAWTVALLSVSYDFEPMARMAEKNDRHDWAHALRTGYALLRR
jgi:predicted phosphodiesterase